MKKIFFALAVIMWLGSSGSKAQPSGPGRMTAEEIAGQKTDMVAGRLDLSEEQRKKVYKLYLKQARDMQAAMNPAMGGMPSGGPGMMRGGGPGGGPGMRGAGPGGMPGGPGGRPPGEMRGGPGDGQGERPAGIPAGPYEEPEKSIAARDKKMKKILTAEQYGQWVVIEKEMQYERFRQQHMRLEPDETENSTR